MPRDARFGDRPDVSKRTSPGAHLPSMILELALLERTRTRRAAPDLDKRAAPDRDKRAAPDCDKRAAPDCDKRAERERSSVYSARRGTGPASSRPAGAGPATQRRPRGPRRR